MHELSQLQSINLQSIGEEGYDGQEHRPKGADKRRLEVRSTTDERPDSPLVAITTNDGE